MEIYAEQGRIQSAIDKAAAAGGGRVIIEGHLTSGTLYLKSNVELHIPAGSSLEGFGTPEAYDDVPFPATVTPENSRKAFIAAENCENIAITGQGTINGHGPEFYDRNVPEGSFFKKPPHPRTRMIQFFNCRNVVMEDITLFDSPGWSCWLVKCENVRIARIRIEGCQQMINNDGIDIDSCRKVTVSDSIFKTGDDCLILRAIRRAPDEEAVCEQVSVNNCILDSCCQGIRIGCPSDDTIRNCQFSNIIINGRGSGICCELPYRYLRKNCTGFAHISDLSFRNFDLTSNNYPVRIFCEGAIGVRGVERLSFRDFRIRSKKPFFLVGNAESVLQSITLADISGVIEADTPLETRFVRDLKLENVNLSAETGEKVPFVRPESPSWESQF